MGVAQVDRIDRIIADSPSWSAFWNRLTSKQFEGADSNKFKGDVFERLTQLYLLTTPEYQSILSDVWLARHELPNEVRRRLNLPPNDEGIDLIAKTRSGEYWSIQSKFRSDQTKPLTYKELSTFSHLSFVACKGISLAVVVHTASKPVRKHLLLKDTTEIGLDRWLELGADDWERIRALCRHEEKKLEPRTPRPHQRDAIAAAEKHFVADKHSRGRLIMPCATGKSLTAYWIAEALGARSILVAVPSLSLVRQSLKDWTREFLAHGIVPDWLCVCSDESTGKLEQDEFVGGTYDLGVPATTSQQKIVDFLKPRSKNHRIVFTTYQSSPVLAAAARSADHHFDLAILDEAHKTVGAKGKSFATLLFDKNVAAKKRMFMTATERVLRGDNDDVLSMDDEKVYGERFFLMTFKEAIAQGVISDYKIITMTVSDARVRELIEENRILNLDPDNLDEAEAQSVAAGIALKDVFKNQKIKHAISFHRSIRSADRFREQQDALNVLTDVGPPSINLHVSSRKSAGDRAQLMRDFVGYERSLLTNARCLTEGVDIPAIDCVLFADPKQSVIDTVQAAGRALRTSPETGKKLGYIMLPLVVPGDMSFEDFSETTAFKQIARTIAALSTQDERIVEEFRAVGHGRLSSGKIVEITGDVPVGMKLKLGEFADAISTRIWDRVGRANWRPFEEARAFARSLGLKSRTAWFEFAKSTKRPADIPFNPAVTYKDKGWAGAGDWLGTGRVADQLREYLPFEDARAFARSLGLKSGSDWRHFKKSGLLPNDIPGTPERTYRGKGWAGMGDWLGTGTIAPRYRKFRLFEEARDFARTLKLKTADEWREFAKSPNRPADVAAAPWETYKEQWVTLGDWLGTEAVANQNREYRSFEDARNFARSLGLKSGSDWMNFATSRRLPTDVPANPARVFKNSGWIGMGDWLGTGAIANRNREYRSFEDARKFARALNLRSRTEWLEYSRSGNRPPDIPSKPDRAYRNVGWAGMGDWLGTGRARRRSSDRPPRERSSTDRP